MYSDRNRASGMTEVQGCSAGQETDYPRRPLGNISLWLTGNLGTSMES